MAVMATVAWHTGTDISPLFMNFRAGRGELWRLVTSALPHVDALHLLFNLYWLWVFGSAVEATFGHLRTAAILLFFAAGSATAEYAAFDGGVGLSGVGYGLFGLLWVLSHWDDRFRDTVDAQTIGLFVAWFILCIALTIRGTWSVGNVAHGMGAAQGILLGFVLITQRYKRIVIGFLVGLMLLTLSAATVGRPYVNRSRHAGEELAYAGYLDLEAGRNESAVAFYEDALRLDDGRAEWWYNLGIGNQRLGREHHAVEAYRHALKLDPNYAVYRKTFAQYLAALAYRKQTANEDAAAVDLYREALALDDRSADCWYNLGIGYEKLGRREAATKAYEKASALAPDDARFRAALEGSRAATQ